MPKGPDWKLYHHYINFAGGLGHVGNALDKALQHRKNLVHIQSILINLQH